MSAGVVMLISQLGEALVYWEMGVGVVRLRGKAASAARRVVLARLARQNNPRQPIVRFTWPR